MGVVDVRSVLGKDQCCGSEQRARTNDQGYRQT